MKIAISGGTGMVGRKFSKLLLSEGHEEICGMTAKEKAAESTTAVFLKKELE